MKKAQTLDRGGGGRDGALLQEKRLRRLSQEIRFSNKWEKKLKANRGPGGGRGHSEKKQKGGNEVQEERKNRARNSNRAPIKTRKTQYFQKEKDRRGGKRKLNVHIAEIFLPNEVPTRASETKYLMRGRGNQDGEQGLSMKKNV